MDFYALREAYGPKEPWTEETAVAIGKPVVAAATEVEDHFNPLVHPLYQQVPHKRDPLTEPIPRL